MVFVAGPDKWTWFLCGSDFYEEGRESFHSDAMETWIDPHTEKGAGTIVSPLNELNWVN